MIVVRAPGKAIVCGEYAVLDGAPAISIAVDRHVVARRAAAGEASQRSPFVDAALAHAARALGPSGEAAIASLRSGIVVDSSALYEAAGQKLGLGSSAAVTAAVVGLAFAEAGRTLDETARPELFAIADAAHTEAQGVQGSGIDVATSIFGGTIFFQRGAGAPTIRSIRWPDALRLGFVFAGESASTPMLVGKVKALATRDASTHRARIGALAELARAFAAALERSDVDAVLAAVGAWQPALAALGHAADAPIVTPVFERISAIAAKLGAVSKPSGAGGGDLAVVLSRTADTAALEAALAEAALVPLLLVPHGPARGLSMETTS